MKKIAMYLVAALMPLLVVGMVNAGTMALRTGPLEPSQTLATVNQLVVDANTAYGPNGSGLTILGGPICTVTGATPQICQGQRGIVTTGTLTTAAATATTYTITNASVSTSSLVLCFDQGYSGTYVTNGYPHIMECKPGAGSIVATIVNTHAANALNGTLAIGFAVLN